MPLHLLFSRTIEEEMQFRCAWAVTAMAALLLVGCGGGGDTPAKPADTPPPVSPRQTGPSIEEIQAGYTPSAKVGLVFLQDGKQLPVTEENGVVSLHLKQGPLKILVPRSNTFAVFYIGFVTDGIYHEGNSVTIGGNVIFRNKTMGPLGWPLHGSTVGSISFNHFSPTDFLSEGSYRALPTTGLTAVNPDSVGLLVYLDQTNTFHSVVPAASKIEYFKLAFH